MPISIDDSSNPIADGTPRGLLKTINGLAHAIKQITGKSSWKDAPDISINQLVTDGMKPGLIWVNTTDYSRLSGQNTTNLITIPLLTNLLTPPCLLSFWIRLQISNNANVKSIGFDSVHNVELDPELKLSFTRTLPTAISSLIVKQEILINDADSALVLPVDFQPAQATLSSLIPSDINLSSLTGLSITANLANATDTFILRQSYCKIMPQNWIS